MGFTGPVKIIIHGKLWKIRVKTSQDFFYFRSNFKLPYMTRKYLVTVAVLGLWAMTMAFLSAEIFTGKMTLRDTSLYSNALIIHFTHTIALLSLTFMNRFVSRSYLNIIYYLFTGGIFFYSGALYVNSTGDLTNIIIGFMEYVVPLGGILLFAGWLVILFTGVTYQHKKRAIHNG